MLDDMQHQKNTAIIVAAGSGSRLGSTTPKQFLKLLGQEILSYSVNSFLDHPQIDAVVIVTSQNFLDHVAGQYPQCKVVLGGETRQDSVFNGVQACSPDTSNVLVHDAARPLIPHSIITTCLSKLAIYEGVAPAIEPSDSMVLLRGDEFSNLNRADLRIIQTPQCFRIDTLRDAHASGNVDTDEIGLVKQSLPGARLGFVPGAPETMKVTSQMDLTIIERYLPKKEK